MVKSILTDETGKELVQALKNLCTIFEEDIIDTEALDELETYEDAVQWASSNPAKAIFYYENSQTVEPGHIIRYVVPTSGITFIFYISKND